MGGRLRADAKPLTGVTFYYISITTNTGKIMN
jgi:hypothetical protein